MTSMKRLLASVAIAAALVAPAQAQDANTVLATVNGADITLGHVVALVENLPDQYQSLPDDVLYQGALDQLINQEALASSVRGNLSRALRLTLELQEKALIAQSLIADATQAEVSEDDLRALYDAEFASSVPAPEFNASHILVDSEETAASLITQIEGGADFAELAKTHSTGPSGPRGGELGWFGLGQMVPEFEQAVLGLEVGAVSAPVQTQFGWHVVTLNERREQSAPAFEDVRANLEGQLREQRGQDKAQSVVEAADVVRAEVDIDPALIRNGDLIAD